MEIDQQGTIKIKTEDIIDSINFFISSLRNRLPRNKKNKIGIVIAIRTTNSDDKVRLENDLILEINNYLKLSESDQKFNIIFLQSNVVNKITDRDIADKYLRKIKAHLIIYGLLEKGKIGGDSNYIFKLNGLVRHLPIPNLLSKTFGFEFRELLPEKIFFSENNEVLGFESTEIWLKYVIKYIIVIASFVSGDLVLAETLIFELKNDIESIAQYKDIPVISEIKKRIPKRITEIMLSYISIYYDIFSIKRDKKYIISCKKYLDIMLEIDPNNYTAHLSRSIYYFFTQQIDNAIQELVNIENQDPTFRLNLGFLFAYKGDINGALDNYKKTFYKPAYEGVYNDTEIFISEIIDAEPKKIQLYFFRGLINFKLKQDKKLAKDDFLYFIQHRRKNQFQKLEKLSLKYINIIEKNR